jgi:hypothetical protein
MNQFSNQLEQGLFPQESLKINHNIFMSNNFPKTLDKEVNLKWKNWKCLEEFRSLPRVNMLAVRGKEISLFFFSSSILLFQDRESSHAPTNKTQDRQAGIQRPMWGNSLAFEPGTTFTFPKCYCPLGNNEV